MNVLTLHDMSNDIKQLYYKTSLRSVEDCFLALSAIQSQTVAQWIKGANVSKLPLKDGGVYASLLFLVQLRNEFTQSIGVSEMVEYFTKHRQIENLSYIMVFASFLSDSRVNVLLDPFKDIIIACSKFSGGKVVDANNVLSDLMTLQKAYVSDSTKETEDYGAYEKTVKVTKKQKRINMFSYLLKMLSNDIASAADRKGKSEFANALRSGILAKNPTEGLSKYLTLKRDYYVGMQYSLDLVKVVFSHVEPEHQNYNYASVKMTLLEVSGQITEDELEDFYKSIEGSRDFSGFMQGDGSEHLTTQYNDNTIYKVWNPEYIVLVSIFLNGLWNKIDVL